MLTNRARGAIIKSIQKAKRIIKLTEISERRLIPMDMTKETFFQYVSGMADEGSQRLSLGYRK